MKDEAQYERFEKRVIRIPDAGCWLWVGGTNSGYGELIVNGKRVGAHRYSYEMLKGKIPEGLYIDHLCRVRCCVNPHHLEAVTNRENVLRGNGSPAVNSRKTTCPRGHPYDKLYKSNGKYRRECSKCSKFHGKNRAKNW